jgi:hypothetical protein
MLARQCSAQADRSWKGESEQGGGNASRLLTLISSSSFCRQNSIRSAALNSCSIICSLPLFFSRSMTRPLRSIFVQKGAIARGRKQQGVGGDIAFCEFGGTGLHGKTRGMPPSARAHLPGPTYADVSV